VGGERTPRVLLLGKPGCHLCDEARVVVSLVCEELDINWAERSILDDPVMATRYAEQIPVILVDGEQHAIWRVDEARLRAALRTAHSRPAGWNSRQASNSTRPSQSSGSWAPGSTK
jgi:hypothetical protein